MNCSRICAFLFTVLFFTCTLDAQQNSNYSSYTEFVEADPSGQTSSKVDLVIFSYDRPLQLYALLESCERYFRGVNSIHVVLRASTEDFASYYKRVKKRFSYIHIHRQFEKKRGFDFKDKVVDALFGKTSKARYCMFAVDDMIITDYVDLSQCVQAMRKHKPWCFSLRLGKNTVLDTVANVASPPPQRKKVEKGIFSWYFFDGQGGWGYPNTVDMTIYRKKDIKRFFKKNEYNNPNTLEGLWSQTDPTKCRGLCFRYSKAVNIPLNVVNESWTLPNMNITVRDLLTFFQEGYKVDIDPFYKIHPYATHVPYTLTFTKR